MINDVRGGYFRVCRDAFSYSYGQNWPQKLGIPRVDGALMPQFGAPGGDRYQASGIYGLIGNGQSRAVNETLSFRDDLTKIVGTHSFKKGYELLHFRLNSTVTNRPSGAFYFDNMTAWLQANGQPPPTTGTTFPDFLPAYVLEPFFDPALTSP